jgi:uncharacterized protein YcgL (UPF0745 family)
MSKAEKLAKQIVNLGIDDVRELQKILENQGFLLGITIVPDSWLREHGVKSAQQTLAPDAVPAENTAQ